MSYTVGVDNDNKTVLKMGEDGLITTLVMSEVAVVQMIRLLSATLENFTVDIKRVD